MLFATHRAHSLFFNVKLFFLHINSVQTSWGFIKTDLCVFRGHAVRKTNLNAKVILRYTDRSFQRIPFEFLHHISATPPEKAREKLINVDKNSSLLIDKQKEEYFLQLLASGKLQLTVQIYANGQGIIFSFYSN